MMCNRRTYLINIIVSYESINVTTDCEYVFVLLVAFSSQLFHHVIISSSFFATSESESRTRREQTSAQSDYNDASNSIVMYVDFLKRTNNKLIIHS